MGQGFSTSNALHVQLARPWYYPGEIVEGVVALNAVDALSIDGLQVEVVGLEKTEVNIRHYHHDGNRTSTYWGNVVNLHLVAQLAPQPSFEPGQYLFNFHVQLPDVLPPSVSFYNYDRNGGKIHYKATARAPRGPLSPSMHAEQEFIVLGRTGPEQLRPVSQESELAVNACCGSAGSVDIRLDLGRSVYGRGDTINAIVTVHNDSTNAYNSIEVYIFMEMTVSCDDKYHSAVVESKVASVTLPGVAPGERLEGSTARRAQVLVPMDAVPTVAAGSKLMSCRHCVRAELPAGCCSTGASCSVPVFIVGGPFSRQQTAPPQQEIAYPPGWSPTVYPPVVLAAPAAASWPENGPGHISTAVQKPETAGSAGSASPVGAPGTPQQQQWGGSFYPVIQYST